tara:strand:- start:32 stop:808 length:777 start_codon:yes stop_codon:yes gene_type:complete
MNTYGIIFCGYNTEDYVLKSIDPFLKRENHIVSAVSVPFAEYKGIDSFHDHTTDLLRELVNQGRLKYLVDFPQYTSEAEARNNALFYLKKYNLDYIWLVDSDEFYTEEDIEKIENYVESSNKNLFKLSLKNHVFDLDRYLEEPFCPPRIFKTKIAIPELEDFIKLENFYWDNDICYAYEGKTVRYDQIEDLDTIPQDVAYIPHYTWLNDRIGKRKVDYQHRHFGHCGYKWNNTKHCLEFDEEFHQKNNIPIPKVICSK